MFIHSGLDGFSNLTEFKFDGVWNSVSGEEFRAFLTRNPNLAILDLNLDMNEKANGVLLCCSKNLMILRLRCSPGSGSSFHSRIILHLCFLFAGSCKKLMSYNWFHVQEHLRYLWIQCDLTNTAEKFLEKLYLLKSLRVLRLDEMKGFTEGFFFQILAVLPALEVHINKNDRNGGIWQSGNSKSLAEHVQHCACLVIVQSSLHENVLLF